MSYRLLSYLEGRVPKAGLLVGDQVHPLPKKYPSVLAALQDWPKASRGVAALAKKLAGKKGLAIKKAKLAAPILYPGTMYCAGANYTDHVAEMERAQGRTPGPNMKELGEKPWHFVKSTAATIVGPGAAVKLPAYSKAVDWEIELAAVIGRKAKDVPVERALACVAGWTIANDLSARDAMKRAKNPPASPFHYD